MSAIPSEPIARFLGLPLASGPEWKLVHLRQVVHMFIETYPSERRALERVSKEIDALLGIFP